MNAIGSIAGRRGRLRLAACGGLAAAGLVLGASAAHAAAPASYVVGGKVTSNDFRRAKSIAVRATSTNTTARALRGKIVIVQVGVLTKFKNHKGKPFAARNLRVGDRVSVTWTAKKGTTALVASVDAPRLVVALKR